MNYLKSIFLGAFCFSALCFNAQAIVISEENSDSEPVQLNLQAVENQPSQKTTASNNKETVVEEQENEVNNNVANTLPPTKGYVYVSDDSTVWVTRGPGKQYRVVGTIKVGEKLKVLRTANGYYEVIGPKGDAVWVSAKNVQEYPSFRNRVSTLEEENSKLKYKLNNIDSETARELKQTSKELANLKEEYSKLQKIQSEQETKLNELTALNTELEGKLETKDQDMQLRWWKHGAVIAFIGIIIGVILVYLPKPKRGRRDDYYY